MRKAQWSVYIPIQIKTFFVLTSLILLTNFLKFYSHTSEIRSHGNLLNELEGHFISSVNIERLGGGGAI